MSRIVAHLRRLAVVHAAPTCCGQPMLPGGGIGAVGGWICQVTPTHVRG